jgi:uncharacterized protein YcnI
VSKTRIAAAVVLCLSLAARAFAHVTVQPRESKPGTEQVYSVRVPTEKPVTTTTVELEVPDGVVIVKVDDIEGVKHVEKEAGDRITLIVWTREIKPRDSAQFTFTAKNPATGDKITWTVHQRYADDSVSEWTPATTLTATASAK